MERKSLSGWVDFRLIAGQSQIALVVAAFRCCCLSWWERRGTAKTAAVASLEKQVEVDALLLGAGLLEASQV